MADNSNNVRGEKTVIEYRSLEEMAPPGILNLVAVCGDYADAIQQADLYFGLLEPYIAFTSSASSER
jgi:hypothetical protein